MQSKPSGQHAFLGSHGFFEIAAGQESCDRHHEWAARQIECRLTIEAATLAVHGNQAKVLGLALGIVVVDLGAVVVRLAARLTREAGAT